MEKCVASMEWIGWHGATQDKTRLCGIVCCVDGWCAHNHVVCCVCGTATTSMKRAMCGGGGGVFAARQWGMGGVVVVDVLAGQGGRHGEQWHPVLCCVVWTSGV